MAREYGEGMGVSLSTYGDVENSGMFPLAAASVRIPPHPEPPAYGYELDQALQLLRDSESAEAG